MSRAVSAQLLLIVVVLVAVLSGCSGDDDEDSATPGPAPDSATATRAPAGPSVTPTLAAATASPTPDGPAGSPDGTPEVVENGDITGIFLEARPIAIANTAALGDPAVQPFDAWDRQTVVLFDLKTGTATNYGPGYLAGFSGDGARFGYNNDGKLWVVDIATGDRTGYEVRGGVASLIGEHYAIAPSGEGSLLDLETGEHSAVQEIADPELRFLVEQRLRPSGSSSLGDGLVLRRENWETASCADTTEAGRERCRAEAFERWRVEDLLTGDVVLAFRAIAAAPAGPGELVIATSPQCLTADGTTTWCEDVLAAMRADLDRSSPNLPFGQGTTNLFLVDIATGEAEFVATASYNPPVFVWPMNWPLLASEDYVVWTESYCGQPQGKTRVLDRGADEITELDAGYWVRWHGDYIGIGAFSSHAIVDPEKLEYVAAVPQELSGIAWSPDFRYAAVGAVLGHGGLCG